MTETNATFTNEEVKKAVTVKWSKMTDGIGLVFAGVMSMLEALDAGTARDIMSACNKEDGGKAGKEDTNAAEETRAGTVDGDAGADDAAVADQADAVEAEPEKEQTAPKDAPAPGITQDDITKIIVQKLKKDRTKAVTRNRRSFRGDIFIRASREPRMAPKNTVMADRANVMLTPLIRNTSQYLARSLMMF